MKTFLAIIVLAAIGIGGYYLLRGKNNSSSETQTNNSSTSPNNNMSDTTTPPATQTPDTNTATQVSDHPVATIDTNMGTFKITLDHTAAPKTVENFVKLSNQGFYNGLKFHRVVANFVIQGGDPKGDGTGGPGYTVPAEIKLTHKKGAIAMARTGDDVNPTRASSGSQFYVALQDLPELDGQYTVFGYVTSGMDVVDAIGKVQTGPGDFPLKDVIINKITIQE
jgi:peptidyl-prolyl cis-trans isomerase A (cyclophilin A)